MADRPQKRLVVQFAILIRLILLATVASTGLSGCITGQPPPSGRVVDRRFESASFDTHLTMEDVVRHTLANDPTLRAARHHVSSAYWDKVQAALPVNPSLSVSVDPTEWSAKLAAQISNWLDLGGQREHRVSVARSREEQAALEVLLLEIELARQVRSVYVEASARQRMEAILERRGEHLERAVSIERQRHELGVLSSLDIFAKERELIDGKTALADHALLRRQAEARLNRYLGRPPQTPLELTEPSLLSVWQHGTTDNDQTDLGMLRRPELALVLARLGEEHAQLELAKITWASNVEAGPLALITQGTGGRYGGGHFSVTLPVFDHGQARRGKAQVRLAALEEELAAVQAQVLLEVHEGLLRTQRARTRIEHEVEKQFENAQEHSERMARMREIGSASDLDMTMVHVQELDARIALEAAHLELWHSRIDLLAALGRCSEDDPLPDSNGTN